VMSLLFPSNCSLVFHIYEPGLDKMDNGRTSVVVLSKQARFCLTTFSLLFIINTQVFAASWTTDTIASLKQEYNDNRRLTTAEHESVTGRKLDLRANINAESNFFETSFKPRVTFERYPGDDELNSNNQYLGLSTVYLTESSRWTLGGNYTRDHTLTSEFRETDLVESQRRRVKWNIDPQWLHEYSDWTIFNLSLGTSSVTYEDAEELGLVDYDVKSTQAVISHSLDEGVTINTTLYGTRLEAPGAGNETDTLGLSVGVDYSEEETFNWGLQLGAQQIEYEQESLNGVLKENESGYTVDLHLTKEFEFSRWNLNLDRSVLPSGVGRLILQNKIEIRNTYDLTQNLRADISITALTNKEIQQGETSQDRDYGNSIVSLRWSIMTDWSLYCAYVYSKNIDGDSSDSATSNVLQIAIYYTGLSD